MLSSIKARIIIFYILVLFIVLPTLGLFLYLSLRKIVYNSIDSSLLSRAKAMATIVANHGNEVEFNFSDAIMSEYNSPKAKFFFQIRHVNGTTVEKSISLASLELPFQPGNDREIYKTISINGRPLRLINFLFYMNNERDDKGNEPIAPKKSQALVIQCAENIDDQTVLLKNYAIVLSGSIFLVMLVSSSGGLLIAKKALMPVAKMTDIVGRISESNLSQRVITENIPLELRALADSFNKTFDRLEKSFKQQKQFTADASHELRTPLSVILSRSEITLRRKRMPDEYQRALAAIEEAARFMSGIVERLLALNRLGGDKIRLDIGKIELKEIIWQAIKLVAPVADHKGIFIKLISNNTNPILGDRAAILELFVNILDNAIKYNIPHGKITISIKDEGAFIATEVQDTGIGITGEDLKQVFNPFFRADKSRSKNVDGIGLGLSICAAIVKRHGGKINIKSQEGRGTTVSVYLKTSKAVYK